MAKMWIRIISRLVLVAVLTAATAIAFVPPLTATLIAGAAILPLLAELILRRILRRPLRDPVLPESEDLREDPIAEWEEDARQDVIATRSSAELPDTVPEEVLEMFHGQSDWVTHLPELLTILHNLGEKAVDVTNEASQRFMAQLISIERELRATNRNHSSALEELAELDQKTSVHEAERAELDMAIDAAVSFNETIQVEISASRGALTEVGRSISDMQAELGQIGKIAKAIDILSVNAGIAAARAGPSGAGFTVIANSIRELANETYNLTSRMEPLIKNARNTINSYTSRVKGAPSSEHEMLERLAEQGALLEGVQIKLGEMALEHGDLLKRNRHEVENSQVIGHHIEASVRSALSAAQFGDIIRQQIETILKSLNAIRELVEADGQITALAVSAEKLIADLASSYVMDSQRSAHKSTDQDQAVHQPAASAIDLF